MPSLFLRWFCFYGWWNTVDVCWVLTQVLYLDKYFSWVTTLTYFMTGTLRTWKTVCFNTAHAFGAYLCSSQSLYQMWAKDLSRASILPSIKTRKRMEGHDAFLHGNTFVTRYETLKYPGKKCQLETLNTAIRVYCRPDLSGIKCHESVSWSDFHCYSEVEAVNQPKDSILQEHWSGIRDPCPVLPCITLDKHPALPELSLIRPWG